MTGTSAPGVVVYDLDGTLQRARAPLDRYATEIAARLPAGVRTRFAASARDHLSGLRPVEGEDDWEALAFLARAAGVDPAALGAAFEATRDWMMAGDCPLEAPDGAADLLRYSAARALTVVASNSPDASVGPLLERLGLGGLVDVVVPMARKPDGFVPAVEAACARHGGVGRPVLSVGDNYRNDIAPALCRGWDAAYIHGGRPHGRIATYAAATFEEIVPAVAVWLDRLSCGAGPGPLTRSARSV